MSDRTPDPTCYACTDDESLTGLCDWHRRFDAALMEMFEDFTEEDSDRLWEMTQALVDGHAITPPPSSPPESPAGSDSGPPAP